MKLTSYFIKHPVVAIILNFLILAVGLLCYKNLTVREYPSIIFPTITVFASYPNADPDLVEASVTNVLEERLAGVEGLENITSQSSSGYSQITMQFKNDVSMDRALSATQDAVAIAKPFLPVQVKSPTVERQRKTNGLPFIGISLESPFMDFGELTHFANLNLKNQFRSIPGIASVEVWGQPYTYSITLDQKKLFTFGINPDEVINVIATSQGSLPAGNYQNTIPSTINFKPRSLNDYEQLVIKDNNGHPIYLKSVADVRLETDHSQMKARVNGHSGLVLSLQRANDANPLEVSKLVQKEIKNIKSSLPKNMQINLIMDQSEFISASIHSIQSAIIEAIILVLLIVFLFLRNFRATLIPLVTIPISLLGSLIFLQLFGYSINLMTLLAMVLAIGLVVDDAIVMLENIWRHIENGLSPFAAAIKGAREIGFAVIAMTLTLASVYIPVAFMQGMLGELFIEFAVALAGSVFISGVVALTLSPLMCATGLKADAKHLLPSVDKCLTQLSTRYEQSLTHVLQHLKLIILVAIAMFMMSAVLYHLLPNETAPKEDRGLIGIYIPPTPGEDLEHLNTKVSNLEKILGNIPESTHQLTFVGDWGGSIIIPLKAHTQRTRSSTELVDYLKPQFTHIPSVDPHVWSWDTSLPGIDNAGSGTELELVISGPESYRDLFNSIEKLKTTIDNSKQFGQSYFDLRLDTKGFNIDLDRNQLAKLQLNPIQVAKAIEVFFSGDRSQTFDKEGVTYNLTIKSSSHPWTLDEIYLTNSTGKRISLGAIAKMTAKTQPAALDHVQQMRSTTLHVQARDGDSLSKTMSMLWKIAKAEMPPQYKLTWSGSAKSIQETSHTMIVLFLLSLLFIFAILSIQFDNFIDPLIILFTVPLACFGALLFLYVFGQSLNIYAQVGLITLVGLISKHGILIVEFANQLHMQGTSLHESILKSAVLRLRPVLMTTGAMMFGAIPLIISHDAGSEARRAIGSVLLGGLGLGTFFTLFIIPGAFVLIKGFQKKMVNLKEHQLKPIENP